ncbi:CBS domain-containing protein [Haladaptatus halobius]|uniref:CBS domain-containing protein n=1 Tax=Haladaptatus halobius TaxID=2884875 RepID=UPI001D0AD5C8|nr:CBS domain-containing protein [Haladaptatus halobius]
MDAEVTIRDMMTREYVGVSESDSVLGAVQLMRAEGVGSVVVLRGSDPVGIMTESDVLDLVAEEGDPADTTVSEVMTSPIVSMNADRSLADAAGTMARQDIRRVIVTRDGELVGILTERDVISASASPSSIVSTREREPDETELRGTVEVNGGDAEYAGQSICEVCGTLTRDLTNVNGQLVCADCREY